MCIFICVHLLVCVFVLMVCTVVALLLLVGHCMVAAAFVLFGRVCFVAFMVGLLDRGFHESTHVLTGEQMFYA